MTIDRTIISLAILKVNWDKRQEDYIENFVPFIATLINRKRYSEVISRKICEDFQEEFGMKIPLEPMRTILYRCSKRGIIKKSFNQGIIPVYEKIAKYDFTDRMIEQERRQNKVVLELQTYVKEKFNDDISKEEIQDAIIEYLKQHDIDILFAAHQQSLLPDVTVDKKKKYYVYKFIQSSSEAEPEVFGYIVDIAIGHALANTIIYENDYRNYQGKLMNLTVYLDIQFLLRLTGVEGDLKKESVLQFLDGIIEKGGTIKVFQHTHDETLGILNGAKLWINKKAYDRSRANTATQFFVENSKTESDVDLCISQLDTLLNIKRIEIETAPDRYELKKYLISESELNENIISKYREHTPSFKEEGKETTIYKDITSISSIYILRKNEKPRHIKHARYIFITTNASLACAARIFEQEQYPDGYVIPACLTDVLLGTAIWLDNPVQMIKFNKMKMIANCVAALSPSRELTKQYLKEVEKLYKVHRITDDQYYYMKADKYVFDILESKTFGMSEYITEKTAEEIMYETILKEKIEGDARLQKLMEEDKVKLETEKDEHLSTLRNFENEVSEKNRIIKNNERIAMLISKIISHTVFIISVIFISLGIFSAIPLHLIKPKWEIVFISVGSIFILLHLVNGTSIIRLKDKLRNWVYSCVIKILIGK